MTSFINCFANILYFYVLTNLLNILGGAKEDSMTALSVNINKIATLRNARGGNSPDLIQVALDCESYGAEGITVHPRPDGRHIRYADVYALAPRLKVEFNIEGYPSKDFIDMVLKVKPQQVTLVPDPPEAITSNAGWDTIAHQSFLKECIQEFHKSGIRTSVFVGTNTILIENAAKTGTNRIELFTEQYAIEFKKNQAVAIAPYVKAAQCAHQCGLGLNAGHDLNLENLQYFYKNIPNLAEVSIGHALICDAIYLGLENTIQLYLRQMKGTGMAESK
jgi:pyridoxine 5-phosphate synthase